MIASRLFYYLTSIPTIVMGMQDWLRVAISFFGLPTSKPRIITLRPTGVRFKVRSLMDIWIIKETCLDRDYEKASVPLKDGWIVLDIGAGLGDFSVCAAYGRPQSLIYAYEPFPESFALLQENVALNRLANVRAFPLAVGSQTGTMWLSTSTAQAVQHSALSASDQLATTGVEVHNTTLDQIFVDQGLQRCDMLKIDCEGAEFEILLHTTDQTLRKIKHICLEYHDGVTQYAHQDLQHFFEAKGFRVNLRPNPVHTQLGFLHAMNPAV